MKAKKLQRLTDEQRARVEENLGLAHWATSRPCHRADRHRYRDGDDMLQQAFLGLCLAAQRWEPGRAKFSTATSYSTFGQIRDPINRDRVWHRTHTVPRFREGDNGAHATDEFVTVPESHDPEPVDDVEDGRRVLKYLDPQARFVVTRMAEGLNMAEIAEELGLSKERVRQIRLRAREVLTAKGVTPEALVG